MNPLAAHIIWLNASNGGLENADLAPISKFVNIEKIRVEANPISNEALDHIKGLKYLNALNLNETKITANISETIETLPSLKSVYVWKTALNESDKIKIESSYPDVEVVYIKKAAPLRQPS